MNIKPIVSSSLGNILEWCDFTLFALYANTFANLFFPSTDHHANLILVFGIFAAGFICRPLGAIIFGHFGDRVGRIKTLRASIFLISFVTLLTGFLPTYQQIGIGAPILLTALRLIQGICIGGEFTGNIIYLAEMAPKKHRALFASFAGTGANMGILLATAMVILNNHWINDWRSSYFFAAAIGFAIYFLRYGIRETDVFEFLKQTQQIVRVPLLSLLRHKPLDILRIIGLIAMGEAFYYLCFIYISTYLSTNVGLSQRAALHIQSYFVLSMLALVPLAGILCDYIGRKILLLIISIMIIIFAIPGFYLLSHGNYFLILAVMLLLTIISSLEQGTTSITVVENFAARLRYTGISLGYNIGAALFGGLAPLIANLLIDHTHSLISPAYYLVGCALLTLITVVFGIKETKHKSLNTP